MDYIEKARGLMPAEVHTDNQRIAAAQAYAAIAQAEQLKRIADALYTDMYHDGKKVGQVSRIGM